MNALIENQIAMENAEVEASMAPDIEAVEIQQQQEVCELNCCGTFGTLGSAGACFGTFGTLGCAG